MNPKSKVLALLLGVTVAACSRADDSMRVEGDAPPPTPSSLAVTEKGIGDLEAGMTVAHAEAILKTSLGPPAGVDSASCRMATWGGAPPGLSLMIEGGNVVRVDVDSGPISTAEGVRVGDAESRVRELYTGRVTEAPHKYAQGRYLTVVPAAPGDSAFRLVFETDGQRVTRYRAGRRPQVEYVERCG
ncbi:MAG TPA: hypothetical protein VFO55_12185 [Gemmatimonadaceae bacterium]|nr:hypothetical protein [Gemmatimonadaceae bacterium]